MRVSLHIEEPRMPDLARLLELLVAHNVGWLEAHPYTPPLYSSGVYYHREERGREEWLDVSHVRAAGWGDCEDLAAWRAAELRVKGVAARAVLRSGGRKGLLHCVVRLPDGRIEDPSRRLKK